MTPRQVVLEALRGGRPSGPPVAIMGGGMWMARFLGKTLQELAADPETMAGAVTEMAGKTGSDIVYLGSGYPNALAASMGGRVIFREVGAVDIDGPIAATPEELESLDPAQVDGNGLFGVIRDAFRIVQGQIGGEYMVTMTAWGPFTNAARILGEEAALKAMYKNPELVERALEISTELLFRLYEPMLADGSLELITLGDPTASGDMISRSQFERFAVPSLKKFTDWARARGALTLLHVCGDTSDRLDLFPLTGFDCVSLDHKLDIGAAASALRGKMLIAGNVDPVAVLLNGDEAAVERASREVLEKTGGAGIMLMPGCDMPPDVPLENIRRFIRTGKDWGG